MDRLLLAWPTIFIGAALFSNLGNSALAASVTFKNVEGQKVELHVRNGPVQQNPDNRGSKNTTMQPSETWNDDVGDGDTWFAYGNQQVNTQDNPPLCNASGGQTVLLDKSQNCYVNN